MRLVWCCRKLAVQFLLGICLVFGLASNTFAQINVNSATATGITGTATNAGGIVSMDIALRSGSLYWTGSAFASEWGRLAVSTSGPSTSKNWSFGISPGLPPGTYLANIRANLANGATALRVTRVIFVDNVRPTSSISIASGSVVSGTVSDATPGSGVSRVEVAIRTAVAPFRYWNGSALIGGYSRQGAVVQINGNWSYNLSPALPPGNYVATSIAFDNARNVQAAPFSNRAFSVNDGVRPVSTIAVAGATVISGGATDNIGVNRVELAISNANGEYFNGAGFGASYGRVTASQNGSGASVSWSYSISPALAPGNYNVVAIAFDTQGNPQAAPFTRTPFTVQAQQPLRIMAVGDSITEGFDSPDDGLQGIRSYRHPFVGLMNGTSCSYEMVGSLTDNLPATFFQSNHEGYSAMRADHFLFGFDNGRLINPGIDATMLNHTPDVVMVHLGSNDIRVGQSPVATSIEIVNDLTDRIFAANPDATVLIANVIPWYSTADGSNISGRIQLLSAEIIRRLQQNPRPNVRFVNVTAGYTPSMMQGDMIHPNAAGDAHIANAFFNALDASGRCGPPGTL